MLSTIQIIANVRVPSQKLLERASGRMAASTQTTEISMGRARGHPTSRMSPPGLAITLTVGPPAVSRRYRMGE